MKRVIYLVAATVDDDYDLQDALETFCKVVPRIKDFKVERSHYDPVTDGMIIWSVEDVLQERPHLTEEQARDVLDHVIDGHDAEWGVSWQTLRDVADIYYPKSDSEEDNEDEADPDFDDYDASMGRPGFATCVCCGRYEKRSDWDSTKEFVCDGCEGQNLPALNDK